MNWGKGIIGGMILFMLFIIAMSIKMFSLPADDFDAQYYEKGLNFDKDQARSQQVVKDHAKPLIGILNNNLNITFIAPAVGTLNFIRQVNKAMDVQFPINTSTANTVTIPLNSIKKGQWQLSMEWKSDGKDYLYQQGIFIK